VAQLAAVPSVDDILMIKKSKRWTQEDLDGMGRFPSGKKKGKGRYGNVNKIEHNGIKFDSKREFLRYMDLRILERAGQISDLKVHPKFPIVIGGIEIRIYSKRYHANGRLMYYEADFSYWDAEAKKLVVEDVKMQSGFRTEVYKIKKALMRAMGYIIEEY